MSTRRYIIDEQGERIGVLLDLEEYQQLTRLTPSDTELLVSLSEAELRALAHSALALAEQEQLDNLLARNADGQLSEADQVVLDHLLHYVDQLSILKTRARYTLAHHANTLPSS
jgi:hypothetical protein